MRNRYQTREAYTADQAEQATVRGLTPATRAAAILGAAADGYPTVLLAMERAGGEDRLSLTPETRAEAIVRAAAAGFWIRLAVEQRPQQPEASLTA